MILNRKNNQKDIQLEIAKKNILKYLQVLRSLSKKFKKNVLDNSQFTDCLCFFTIDKIHLVKKCVKGFWLLYTKIEKVQKRISCHIPFLNISAIPTKKVCINILEKTGFYPDYCPMQTLLDQPKILQIYCFMEYAKFSYLDLRFFLLKVATKASNIQKTIIFVNNISKIRPIIDIFQE